MARFDRMGEVMNIDKLGITKYPWKAVDPGCLNASKVFLCCGADNSTVIHSTGESVPSVQDRKVIEAAPEMLEALIQARIELQRLIHDNFGFEEGDLDHMKINGAIEKATGLPFDEVRELVK